jgi:PAS domain S-box-containing protein
MGKTIEEAFPPLAETEIPEMYRRAAADGTPWHSEQIHYEDDLIQGAYEVHAFQTAPNVVTVVFLDITDRKRAEEQLRDSEARYRSLFERNLAGVFRSSVDGEIIECNEAYARILGCASAEEAMSQNAEAFYRDPADRTRLIERIDRFGELRNREVNLRRADGIPVCVLANMSLTRDEFGRPKVFEGTMIDITERKQTEDRLLLQSTALAAAANAIAITDPSGEIEWTNPSFTALTGYTSAEAIGRSLWALKSGQSDDNPGDEILSTVSDGMAWQGELVSQRRDGRLYTEEMTVTPVRSEQGEVNHLIAVQQDISQRKHIEEQLLQAQKMEAVGRLAGGVAHDFNNLLQAMLGATELLRRRAAEDDDAASRLSELEEHVRRGSQLTRQLLLFSRRDTEHQEQLDLNDVAHGTVKLLHRLLRENIELVFVPADIDLPLIADRGQIEQVIMNLAVNACDAMPRGGRLFLRTGKDAESAWLEVADSGEGIPDEIRDQLFEPFFTTKDPGKGTGLGLSVVHEIVTRLGGAIDLESNIGRGTSIRITFPSIESSAEHDPVPMSHIESAVGDGQRILVVEDDPAVRSGLSEILGVLGYDVTTVGSREETVYLPPAPSFDLLLTDYVLPDGSGTDIARDLCERWPGLRVIVMSGYAQDVPIGPDSKIDGMEFLQKPFSTEKLADTVKAVLAEEPDSTPAALDASA